MSNIEQELDNLINQHDVLKGGMLKILFVSNDGYKTEKWSSYDVDFDKAVNHLINIITNGLSDRDVSAHAHMLSNNLYRRIKSFTAHCGDKKIEWTKQ